MPLYHTSHFLCLSDYPAVLYIYVPLALYRTLSLYMCKTMEVDIESKTPRANVPHHVAKNANRF